MCRKTSTKPANTSHKPPLRATKRPKKPCRNSANKTAARHKSAPRKPGNHAVWRGFLICKNGTVDPPVAFPVASLPLTHPPTSGAVHECPPTRRLPLRPRDPSAASRHRARRKTARCALAHLLHRRQRSCTRPAAGASQPRCCAGRHAGRLPASPLHPPARCRC